MFVFLLISARCSDGYVRCNKKNVFSIRQLTQRVWIRHCRRVRKQFSYEADDESVNLNPTDKFRTTFFLFLLDNAIASFSQRFEQKQEFQKKLRKNFGFLLTIIHNRCCINKYEMKANCLNLQTVLSSKSQSQNQSNTLCSDNDCISLFDELKALHNIMPDNICSILELTFSTFQVFA
jgi:hypothetical protein